VIKIAFVESANYVNLEKKKKTNIIDTVVFVHAKCKYTAVHVGPAFAVHANFRQRSDTESVIGET